MAESTKRLPYRASLTAAVWPTASTPNTTKACSFVFWYIGGFAAPEWLATHIPSLLKYRVFQKSVFFNAYNFFVRCGIKKFNTAF